jgi:hypothetical protein
MQVYCTDLRNKEEGKTQRGGGTGVIETGVLVLFIRKQEGESGMLPFNLEISNEQEHTEHNTNTGT